MQFLTLEQLRKTHETGAVQGITLRAEGGSFKVQVETLRGVFALVKARRSSAAAEVRRFADPRKALLLLRELGIQEAHIDGTDWRPADQAAERRSRPDRAVALKAAHAALSHSQWVQEKVTASRASLADGSNPRISADEWEEVRRAKKAQRDAA